MEEVNTAEEQLNIENISNEVLLNMVTDRLNYRMVKDILVKPLDPIKIKRITNVPVKTDELDEEGQPVMTMEQKEIEIESNFREGIILALPTNAAYDTNLTIGTKIAYPHKYAIDFDLFKDSVLVKPYDIVAIVD